MNAFVIENGVLVKYVGTDENVMIPESVLEIGEKAFYGCKQIRHVSVPTGVLRINEEAFSCSSLNSIMLPDTLQEARLNAFRSCHFLKKLEIPENTDIGNITTGPILNCSSMTHLIIPDSIEFLALYEGMMFNIENCNALTCLVCPGIGIEKIAPQKRNAAARGYIEYLERYRKPEIIESYNRYLFGQKKKLLPFVWECDAVGILDILSVAGKIAKKEIDTEYLEPAMKANAAECVRYLLDWKNKNISQKDAERIADKALSVSFEKDPYNEKDMRKKWEFEKQKDGTLKLTKYKGDETEIVVPERIGEIRVGALGKQLFSPNAKQTSARKLVKESIVSILIPAGITIIENDVFFECKGLKSVTLPDTVRQIGAYAFAFCQGLTKIYIPKNVVHIGEAAFLGDAIQIYGTAGSYVQTYAFENKILFIAE